MASTYSRIAPALAAILFIASSRLDAAPPEHLLNTWVKRSPLADAPVSPRLGYETSIAYDPVAKRVLRWAGHSQGGIKGSGDQIHDIWALDPATMEWELKEPNRSPPPTCCAQQNVFDTSLNRFLRLRSGGGSHGWHFFRQLYLNSSTAWNFDLATNTWRDPRPLPEPRIGLLNCASWDTDRQVAVVFGGEGTQPGTHIYDSWTNIWTTRRSANEPASRSGGNMVYDSANKVHVLFGSQFTDDPHTWTYDLAKNEWRDMQPVVQPPTDQNDAVLAYDAANEVVIAVVRVRGERDGDRGHLETWAYDAAQNTWTAMKPAREPQGNASRARYMTYIPDQNLVLLESSVTPHHRIPGVDREQQIWTYRFAEAEPVLPPKPKRLHAEPRFVEDVVVSVPATNKAEVNWVASTDADVVGYHVERAAVEVFSEDQVIRLKTDTPPLDPPSAGAIKAIGEFERLTKKPVAGTSYIDESLDLTKPHTIDGELLLRARFRDRQLDADGQPYRYAVYAYRVRAVNKQGKQSGPSPYILTIPSAPQHVFSREDGETCHFKWAANPEQGIVGYRLYWMKGPRPEGPGQKANRLVTEPIATTTYTDEEAGGEVRRYWVTAVDALGQEGAPSSGTWHHRTCRDFYAPFVGEWHQ